MSAHRRIEPIAKDISHDNAVTIYHRAVIGQMVIIKYM